MTAEELAREVLDASLYWTGEDEERNPLLKRIRSLAGFVLDEARSDDPCQECAFVECDGCPDDA